MNKKVMALAVAGALAAPAAALAQVQIGGAIHLQYYDHDSGATNSKSTDVLVTSEPEMYIRGEEALGGGLSAWFQCTSSFDVLGQGLGAFCGRNSAIGFKGGFGNIFAGTWDTPHKLVSNLARGWWGGTNTLQGGSLVLLAQGSDSNVGNTGITFFRRHRRLISYHSPDFGGFSFQAGVSAGNESTALSEASPLKPRLMSLAGQFKTGPFFAGIGYEKHDDFNPGATIGITTTIGGYTGGSDSSFNVAVGYTFAGARLSALYMKNEWEGGGAGGTPVGAAVETDGFAVYLDWRIAGPHALKLQYATVSDVDVTGIPGVGTQTSSGAKIMGAAYAYSFSKRTEGYIAFNQLKNDTNASYSFGTATSSSGGKQRVIGVGLKHSF